MKVAVLASGRGSNFQAIINAKNRGEIPNVDINLLLVNNERADAINIAKKHGLRVIEDAAHSFGCEGQGTKIGNGGDITCFSFDGIKNITSGEGGAVCSRDPEIIEKVKNYRLLSIEKDSQYRYNKKRKWEFDINDIGWRYHMGDLYASIGIEQLKRLDQEFAPKRIKLRDLYRTHLKEFKDVKLFESTHLKEGNLIYGLFNIILSLILIGFLN